jgi:hypothetical protein
MRQASKDGVTGVCQPGKFRPAHCAPARRRADQL